MSKTDVKETRGNIQNKLKNKEMSRNIISDYMLGLQARADTSSADIIADIINPQHEFVALAFEIQEDCCPYRGAISISGGGLVYRIHGNGSVNSSMFRKSCS